MIKGFRQALNAVVLYKIGHMLSDDVEVVSVTCVVLCWHAGVRWCHIGRSAIALGRANSYTAHIARKYVYKIPITLDTQLVKCCAATGA